MSKEFISLSGIDGLTSRYYGDLPYLNSRPELRTLGTANMLAEGVCNPITRLGYLTPANSTYTSVTPNQTDLIGSAVIDVLNSKGYFLERDAKLYELDTLTDTTFDTLVTIAGSGVNGNDLKFYSINGVRRLLYIYQKTSGGGGDMGIWNPDSTFGFLLYDAESAPFTIGETLTGAGGATATIQGIVDNGSAGKLMLSSISGTFVNDENITDSATGDATVNGVVTRHYDTFFSEFTTNGFNFGSTNNTRIIVADNGLAYIIDGSSLHKLDGAISGGATGTTTANVLLFPAYFQLVDGVDIRGTIWLALTQDSRDIYDDAGQIFTDVKDVACGVYIWDRQSTQVQMQDYIPIDGIREIRTIFAFRGVPHCFTISNERRTQLRVYTGNEFKVVKTLGNEAYPRFPDSVRTSGDLIEWFGNDGKFYAFGKADAELQENDGLYMIGDATSEATNFQKGGSILPMSGLESTLTGLSSTTKAYYISYVDNGTPVVKRWYPYAFYGAGTVFSPHQGDVFTLVKILPKLSHVDSITLFYPKMIQTGTTRNVDVKIYFNQSTIAWATIQMTYDDGARGFKYIPIGESNVNSIQLEFEYKTGITMYDGTNKDHVPAFNYAEVDFIDKIKKK